jgi:hypothetical protein
MYALSMIAEANDIADFMWLAELFAAVLSPFIGSAEMHLSPRQWPLRPPSRLK